MCVCVCVCVYETKTNKSILNNTGELFIKGLFKKKRLYKLDTLFVSTCNTHCTLIICINDITWYRPILS